VICKQIFFFLFFSDLVKTVAGPFAKKLQGHNAKIVETICCGSFALTKVCDIPHASLIAKLISAKH